MTISASAGTKIGTVLALTTRKGSVIMPPMTAYSSSVDGVKACAPREKRG
jgi:hypothetical protein